MENILDVLYKLFVNSGIVCFFKPLVRKYIVWCWRQPSNSNHITVDDSGSTMRLTKLNGTLYPAFGTHNYAKIKHLQIRNNDVMICGYPKTGCHWIFEIVRMILKKTTSVSKYGKEFGGFLEAMPEFYLDSLPSPRILNTHLPYADLPREVKMKRTKIILTTRCPKDTVVSDYNHHINLKGLYQYDGSFDDYFKLFMRGEVDYGSYFQYTRDWKNVMTSPEASNPILLVEFEELKGKTVEIIQRIATFLEIDITRKFAEDISHCTEFKRLKAVKKKDKITSILYRKGVVGDWKNWMTDAQRTEMDARFDEIMDTEN